MRTHLVATLALAVFVLFAPPARADDAPPAPAAAEPTKADQAEALKAEGDAAMGKLAYDQALDLYTRAYNLDPNPALLYNRGRAFQALTRYPEALDQLESFDRQAPAELKAKVPKLAELIADLKSRVSTLHVSVNVAGARVLVRQRLVGTSPVATLRLNAGPATVEVLADGYHRFKKTVTLAGGSSLELPVELHSKSTTGLLEVSSPVAGAVVLIDGQRQGSVPVQVALPAGSHEVVVRHPGYDEAKTSAVVSVGGSSRLDVPLESPPPITKKWWFWTGVGAVVVGGVALTAALLTERSADSGSIAPGRVSAPLLHF